MSGLTVEEQAILTAFENGELPFAVSPSKDTLVESACNTFKKDK